MKYTFQLVGPPEKLHDEESIKRFIQQQEGIPLDELKGLKILKKSPNFERNLCI
jgi:hypothetical protein